MSSLIERHHVALAEICRRHHVKRLELFGSATTGAFDPDRSDLDFLVEFDSAPDMTRADQFFGLLDALKALFGRDVDLVSVKALRNPYFIRAVNDTRRTLYAA